MPMNQEQKPEQYRAQEAESPEDWDMDYLTAEAILEGLGSLHPFGRQDPTTPLPPIPQSFQRSYNDI